MQDETFWWSGPIGGLGNRLIAIAAVKACIDQQQLKFPWLNDPSCPGEFHDILDPIPNLKVATQPQSTDFPLSTHNWEPLSIYKQLKKDLDLKLTQTEFCLRFVDVLRHLPFKGELRSQASEWRQKSDQHPLIGVHVRRTDRLAQHRTEFRRVIMRKQGLSRELPLMKSAVYGVFPPGFIALYENWALGAKLKAVKLNHKNFGFAIFADNYRYADGVKNVANWRGVNSAKHLVQAPISIDTGTGAALEQRETGLKSAVVDMLCLAACDAIIQNNRASTFSLVASMVGMTPIISEKTNYPFWHAIEDASVHVSNGEGFSSQITEARL